MTEDPATSSWLSAVDMMAESTAAIMIPATTGEIIHVDGGYHAIGA